MLISDLLKKERKILDHFFSNVNTDEIDRVVALLHQCKGLVILTGVGKSALVARKIAETMTSVGSRAIFLSPENALHGDIGLVSSDDICLFLSKSGESDELLHLAPYIRNKGALMIACVFNANSRLSKACDETVTLPLLEELCPFDLAPTASCVIQMIFGDALAVALMQKQQFTKDEYMGNHPAGRIGKRMLLKVQDLMLQGDSLPLCSPRDRIIDELVELSHKRCGCILVVDADNTLLGIFTDGDLRRALLSDGSKALEFSMEKAMTKDPRCIAPSQLAVDAMYEMEKDQSSAITVLPVVDEQRRVLGLIKLHDIVQSGL